MPALDFSDQAVAEEPLDFSKQAEPALDFSSQAVSEEATIAPVQEPATSADFSPESDYTPPNFQSLKEFFTAHPNIPKPDTSGVKPGVFNPVEKAAVGLIRSGIGAVESIATPLTAGLAAVSAIPAVGKPLAIAAGAGFGAATTISGAQQFYEAVQKGDVQGAAEAAGNVIFGTTLVALGGKEAAKGEVPVVATKLAPVTAQAFKETTGATETFSEPPPVPTLEKAVSAPLTSAVAQAITKPEVVEPAKLDFSAQAEIPKASVAEAIPTPEQSDALGISPTAHPAIRAIADIFNPEGVGKAIGAVKDFFGGLAGRSMPKITRANRELGELGVRWASSRIAAKPLADVFATEALSDSGIDPKKLGTALTEDNLRSVRRGFEEAGDEASAAGVHSVIGSRGSPFATEADYQAFLADPATQAAIERYKQLWDAQVEPMYKKAMMIDPDEVLPSRGEQTGARVNLMAIREGEPTAAADIVQGIGRGNLLGTLKRKSPFGVRAKGTGQSYNGNLFEMMNNTFGRQLEIANKNAFETRMVETGDAVIMKPGQHPILKDEATVSFPYVRQRLILPQGEGPTKVTSQNQSIYVRKSLAKEYSRASNTETRMTGGPITRAITGLANRSALAGFTDATVHTSNLATVLMTRPAIAGKWWQDTALSLGYRADLVPIAARAIKKAFSNNAKQIAELSEIGAMRQEYPKTSRFNPMGWLSDLIHIADRTTRLVMDDAFKELVKDLPVENTETNRREWVNQTGQYNKRLQGKWTAAARDSGLSPFITAGRTFTALGIRNITLNPGLKTSTLASAAALRANIAAKWIGTGVLAATLNYLLTRNKPGGGMQGRPGTPIGDIDSGKDDENGRPLVFPLTSLLGLGRGLRLTGVRGYVEAKRKGLPSRVAMDSAVRDIINSQASMIAGPPVRLAIQGASGYAPAVNVGRALPVVPPGQSQHLADLKGAIIEGNPILSSIHAANEPGGSLATGLQKQFPRFTLAPKQPPDMLAHYPEIVRKAQANDYIDDVIGRARKMAPEAKMKFLEEAVSRLEAQEDKAHAWREFKRRRVLRQ